MPPSAYICYTSPTVLGPALEGWAHIIPSDRPWEITDRGRMDVVWDVESFGDVEIDDGAITAIDVRVVNPRPVSSMPEWTDPVKQTMLALNAICIDNIPIDFSDGYARWVACILNNHIRERYPGCLSAADLYHAREYEHLGVLRHDDGGSTAEQINEVARDRWMIFHIPFPPPEVVQAARAAWMQSVN